MQKSKIASSKRKYDPLQSGILTLEHLSSKAEQATNYFYIKFKKTRKLHFAISFYQINPSVPALSKNDSSTFENFFI